MSEHMIFQRRRVDGDAYTELWHQVGSGEGFKPEDALHDWLAAREEEGEWPVELGEYLLVSTYEDPTCGSWWLFEVTSRAVFEVQRPVVDRVA